MHKVLFYLFVLSQSNQQDEIENEYDLKILKAVFFIGLSLPSFFLLTTHIARRKSR